MKPEIRWFEKNPLKEMRVQRVDGQAPKITGYPIVFNSWSDDLGGFREMIMPEARVAVDRGGDFESYFNHDPNQPLGKMSAGNMTVVVDDMGIYLEVAPLDTSYGRDLMTNIDGGLVTGGSFQFWVNRDEWNGDYSERRIYDFALEELGPVTRPAYPATTAQVRSLAQAGIDYRRLSDALEGKDVEAIRALIEALESQLPERQVPDGAQTERQGSLEILRKRLDLLAL